MRHLLGASLSTGAVQVEVFSYPLGNVKIVMVCSDGKYDSEMNRSGRISSTLVADLDMQGGHAAHAAAISEAGPPHQRPHHL